MTRSIVFRNDPDKEFQTFFSSFVLEDVTTALAYSHRRTTTNRKGTRIERGHSAASPFSLFPFFLFKPIELHHLQGRNQKVPHPLISPSFFCIPRRVWSARKFDLVRIRQERRCCKYLRTIDRCCTIRQITIDLNQAADRVGRSRKGVVNMKRIPMIVMTAFAVGFMAALMTVSGCSEAATRTLTLLRSIFFSFS